MPLNYNGKSVENVTYNGKEVKKILYNGSLVWEKVEYVPSWKRVYSGNYPIEFNYFEPAEFHKTIDGVEPGYETRVFFQVWLGQLNSSGNAWTSGQPEYGETRTLPTKIESTANSIEFSLDNYGDLFINQKFYGGSNNYGIPKVIIEYVEQFK